MRVGIFPGAFKGTLTAREAGEAMSRGVRRAWPNARILLHPLGDGGAGTLEALAGLPGMRRQVARVRDPWGRPRRASWLFGPARTAYVESAEAIGWGTRRRGGDPWKADSGGVGELVRAAWRGGARRLVIGLGDTLTVDGGLGLLRVLGCEAVDRDGTPVPAGGRGLEQVAGWRCAGEFWNLRAGLRDVTILCDVMAPLLGPAGAARGFGPQKGASPAIVRRLESGMTRWAAGLSRLSHVDVASLSGAGAAGGVGAGLAVWLKGRLVPGAGWLLVALRVVPLLRRCDLVITGEGRLDRQSPLGKAPWAVAAAAARLGRPCLYVAGAVNLPPAIRPRGVRVVRLGPAPRRRSEAGGVLARAMERACGAIDPRGGTS